jgi:hypothetical protein
VLAVLVAAPHDHNSRQVTARPSATADRFNFAPRGIRGAPGGESSGGSLKPVFNRRPMP